MRAQTILFLLVDRVREKLDCRPYRGGGEGNPKRLEEAASLAFSNRSIFLTIRVGLSLDSGFNGRVGSGLLCRTSLLAFPYGQKTHLASEEGKFPRPKPHAASRS